ncbi:hypothetical protein ACWD3J_14345 [Streptomyces sp. NPDC002755]
MPPAEDRDYAKLAKLSRRRRSELGLALNDANAKAGGLSNRTWQRVEKGLAIRDTNYVKIDGLLHWAPGSCLAVLEGGEPTPVEPVAANPDAQTSPMPPQVLDAEARDVVSLALVATATGSTAEEIREMSERVVRDLREHGLI